MPIEGFIILPKEVYVTLCVETMHLSDHLLKVARIVQRVSHDAHLPDDLMQALLRSNAQLGLIENVLKAISEENGPIAVTTNGGPGDAH